jgi:hypothetical protein
MSVSITVTQTNTVVPQTDGTVKYQVRFVIDAAEEIPLALFVFETEDDSYCFPATLYDLEAYPDTKNAAIAQGLDRYRASEVTRIYELLLDALDFISVTHSRLQSVVNEFKNAEDAFAGTETFTLTQS